MEGQRQGKGGTVLRFDERRGRSSNGQSSPYSACAVHCDLHSRGPESYVLKRWLSRPAMYCTNNSQEVQRPPVTVSCRTVVRLPLQSSHHTHTHTHTHTLTHICETCDRDNTGTAVKSGKNAAQASVHARGSKLLPHSALIAASRRLFRMRHISFGVHEANSVLLCCTRTTCPLPQPAPVRPLPSLWLVPLPPLLLW